MPNKPAPIEIVVDSGQVSFAPTDLPNGPALPKKLGRFTHMGYVVGFPVRPGTPIDVFVLPYPENRLLDTVADVVLLPALGTEQYEVVRREMDVGEKDGYGRAGVIKPHKGNNRVLIADPGYQHIRDGSATIGETVEELGPEPYYHVDFWGEHEDAVSKDLDPSGLAYHYGKWRLEPPCPTREKARQAANVLYDLAAKHVKTATLGIVVQITNGNDVYAQACAASMGRKGCGRYPTRLGEAVCTRSGHGDGWYPLIMHEHQETKAMLARIEFISDEEETGA